MRRESAVNSVYYAHGVLRAAESGERDDLEALDLTADKIITLSFVENREGMSDSGVIASWDVSANQDGSLSAWVTAADNESGSYNLFIGGDEAKIIPPNWSYGLFGRYVNCVSVSGLEHLDTGGITSMGGWFTQDRSLTSLNVSTLDTSGVTSFGNMFEGCAGLTTLELENFDTANASSIAYMFHGCTGLETLDLRSFDTRDVTSMKFLFNNCTNLHTVLINPDRFSTAKVTTMERMFYGCKAMDYSILKYFDTGSVENMSYMFCENTEVTELDVSGFDTSKVTDMSKMFRKCISLEHLDLSNFDTGSVTEMDEMFWHCTSLKTLILGNKFDRVTGKDSLSYCQQLTIISLVSKDTEPGYMRFGDETDVSRYNILYVTGETLERQYEADEAYITAFQSSYVNMPDIHSDLYRIRPMLELNGSSAKTVGLGSEYTDPGLRVFGQYADNADKDGDCTPDEFKKLGFRLTASSNVNTDTATDAEHPYSVIYTLTYKGDEVARVRRDVTVCPVDIETAFDRMKNMRVGYSLGNSLDAMFKERGYYLDTETLWSNPKVSKEQIDLIRDMGFTALRLGVSYYNHIDENGRIDQRWLERVRTVVDYGLGNGMYVIINVHHDTGMNPKFAWIHSDAESYENDVSALKNIWLQTAEFFKDYNDKLMFELTGEIVDADFALDYPRNQENVGLVHDINQELIELIRGTGGNNAERFLILCPYGAIADNMPIEMMIGRGFEDTADNRIIAEVHDYRTGTESVDNLFSMLSDYARRYDIPFLVGEFGTQSTVEHSTRLEAADAYAKCAAETGVGIIWWDDGLVYDLFDRNTLKITHQDIVNAILRYDREDTASTDDLITVTFRDALLWQAVMDRLETPTEWNKTAMTITAKKEYIEGVTSLKLNNLRIESISGLEAFTGLTALDISNNAISDITPLSSLTGLKSLCAYGNQIADVTPLQNLTSLSSLKLSSNKLRDTAGQECITAKLQTLTALEELELAHNMLRYTEGLNKLVVLKRLDLFDNAIRDIGGLRGMDGLTHLWLGENNEYNPVLISNLDALDGLTGLEFLDFAENNTPDIPSHLTDMTALEELYLNSNSITDITALSGLTKLRVLILFANNLTDISPLFGLSELEELNVGRNSAMSLDGIAADDTTVWPKIKKLDISENWRSWRSKERKALYAMYLDGSLELSFEYDPTYEVTGLPHIDENGISYVTYEDFGARCDGIFDDAIAIKNAHNYANSVNCEVRASAGKTYHIYKYYTYPIAVRTNTDWQHATFIIHDEDIEHKITRFNRIFAIQNTGISGTNTEAVVIDNPDWTIDTSTKKLENISEILKPLNALGFEEYYCKAENTDKHQFIRFGMNANNGEPQKDFFKIDSEGNLLNDVQWDFDKITSFTIWPIPKEKLIIKNGNFITNAVESRSETPYTRGEGKSIYYYRVLRFGNCANMEISGINHTLSEDVLSGSYCGFFWLINCVDTEMHDCTLFARKYTEEGRSTYDLTVDHSTNMYYHDLTSNDIHETTRWGIMGTNYTKDILYERCYLNRIDAHQGVYNLTIRDCETRAYSLAGQGTLNVYNSTIWGDSALVSLRGDYGSFWNGKVNIIDCKMIFWGHYLESLFNITFGFEADGTIHDFGYDCHFPDVYVENLTIDNQYASSRQNLLRLITNWESISPEKAPASYWPNSFVLNGYQFINSEHMDGPWVRITASGAGEMNGDFIVTDAALRLGSSTGENVIQRAFSGEEISSDQPVYFKLTENNSTANEVTVYKDGVVMIAQTEVEGVFEHLFTEQGSYEIKLTSVDSVYSRNGEKTLSFSITGDSATPVLAFSVLRENTALRIAAEQPLSSIPNSALNISVTIDETAVSEWEPAYLIFAGYDIDGRLDEVKLVSVDAAEPSMHVKLLVENTGRQIASGKLFLLSDDFLPLAAGLTL